MRDALNLFNREGREVHKGNFIRFSFVTVVSFVLKLFSPENIWAFVLFLILIALIIFTADSSPVWIYQGF